MSDYSLMNLDVLKKDIELQTAYTIEEGNRFSKILNDTELITQLVAGQYNDLGNDTVTLTREEVSAMLKAVGRIRFETHTLRHLGGTTIYQFEELQKNPWFRTAAKIRSIFVK